MKLVSVIIPTHKGSQYVKAAVESVINQTYPHVEIIVVDDNGYGTEEQLRTEEVLSIYIKTKKIKYITHEINKNGSAARNTGFANSRGDYICLLDDDDEYYPDKVEKEAEALENLDPNWGMVYCGNEGSDKGKSGDLLFELLIHSVVIGSNSFLVKREIWNKLGGFDESFRRHQDYEFTARVASVTRIKYLRFVGFKSRDIYRNSPRNLKQAQEQRAHYLNKMMPLIRRYSINKQKFVICCNCMEVTSKGKMREIKCLKEYAEQWDPQFSNITILMVSVFKVFRKLKWMIFKNRRKSNC